VTVENPAALRFIIGEDLYLLKGDKSIALSKSLPVGETFDSSPQKASSNEPTVSGFKYLGRNNKRFLVMVHYADNEFIDDTHLTALQNILKRMELYMDDVAILNTAAHDAITFEAVTGYFKPEKLLLMGQKAVPQDMEAPVLNQPRQLGNCLALYSFSFDEMMSSNENKRVFWDQVKTL